MKKSCLQYGKKIVQSKVMHIWKPDFPWYTSAILHEFQCTALKV